MWKTLIQFILIRNWIFDYSARFLRFFCNTEVIKRWSILARISILFLTLYSSFFYASSVKLIRLSYNHTKPTQYLAFGSQTIEKKLADCSSILNFLSQTRFETIKNTISVSFVYLFILKLLLCNLLVLVEFIHLSFFFNTTFKYYVPQVFYSQQ